MKKAALCLVAIATLAFGADIDKSLLTSKTWKCFQQTGEGEHTATINNVINFHKDGTYTSSMTVQYVPNTPSSAAQLGKPQRSTLNINASGEWKLDGDKLVKHLQSFKASSEDNPEQAAMYDHAEREGMKDIKRLRKVELAHYTTILELTSAKMTLKYINAKSPYVCEAE
jgi:hypothetical protein